MWLFRNFFKNDLDLGKCNILKHKITLTDHQPFKVRYRKIPPDLFKEVKQHLQEMVEVGAIRRSFSPWASAMGLVRKKDGGLRLCTDLWKLNNLTIKDGYALPRIDNTLDCLHGAMWFSTLDLKSGYWQVELEEEARPLTAFTMGPLRTLGVWENAFWAHQCSSILSKVDGVLSWWVTSELVHYISGWYYSVQLDSRRASF